MPVERIEFVRVCSYGSKGSQCSCRCVWVSWPCPCSDLLSPVCPDPRKRPGEEGGFGDRKRSRVGEDSKESSPATLRALVRNRDAGGIIGKVGRLSVRMHPNQPWSVL